MTTETIEILNSEIIVVEQPLSESIEVIEEVSLVVVSDAPQGPAGPPGNLSFDGAWSALVQYTANSAVSYQGAVYKAIATPLLGSLPTNVTYWELLIPKGEKGDTGAPGADSFVPGPPGNDGADGTDGADGRTILYDNVNPTTEGVDGDFFINTITNFIFGPKLAGVWPAGTNIKGDTGAAGADGNTILYGTVDPTTEGVSGDFYINTSTNFIFGPKSVAWPLGTSLVGAPGSNGTNGTDGADGIDGVDGKTILSGVVDPTTEGVDGDFYINTATSFLFGPKAAGVWPAGISLVGATGANGLDGKTILNGTSNPTTQGVNGDFYINTATNFLFGPKASGTWPAGVSIVGPQGDPGVVPTAQIRRLILIFGG